MRRCSFIIQRNGCFRTLTDLGQNAVFRKFSQFSRPIALIQLTFMTIEARASFAQQIIKLTTL